jgi:uncharacterized protein
MKALHLVTFILVIVGAVNWGLVGLGYFAGADWNVVSMILGSWPQVEAAVYVLVGLSAIWLLVKHPKECRTCMGMGSSSM